MSATHTTDSTTAAAPGGRKEVGGTQGGRGQTKGGRGGRGQTRFPRRSGSDQVSEEVGVRPGFWFLCDS